MWLAPALAAAQALTVTAARLLEVETGRVLREQVIRIENGTIVSVAARAAGEPGRHRSRRRDAAAGAHRRARASRGWRGADAVRGPQADRGARGDRRRGKRPQDAARRIHDGARPGQPRFRRRRAARCDRGRQCPRAADAGRGQVALGHRRSWRRQRASRRHPCRALQRTRRRPRRHPSQGPRERQVRRRLDQAARDGRCHVCKHRPDHGGLHGGRDPRRGRDRRGQAA